LAGVPQSYSTDNMRGRTTSRKSSSVATSRSLPYMARRTFCHGVRPAVPIVKVYGSERGRTFTHTHRMRAAHPAKRPRGWGKWAAVVIVVIAILLLLVMSNPIAADCCMPGHHQLDQL